MSRSATRNPWAWIPTLYFIEGLPNAIIVTLTVILYKDFGYSNGEIAFYTGLMYLPWVIKPFWSPIVDILRSKRWWIVSMQLLLTLCFAGIALALPGKMFFIASIGLMWIAAFTSATNDIASDGFYMLALTENEQSIFVGIRSFFYRVSTWFIQFGVIYLAGRLQNMTGDVTLSWQIVFWVLTALFGVLTLFHSLVLPYPPADVANRATSIERICSEFIDSFATFFKKPHIITALAFMLLYRFPEAQLAKIINLFLLDSAQNGGLELTKEQVSIAYGFWGAGGMIAGGILGGLYAAKRGLKKSLVPMAWAMSLCCLSFVLLSRISHPSAAIINACVCTEQFGYGFGFSAYMLYLIYYSTGEYSTSHYAICTGFMALSIMLPGMVAGWIQELLGYANFFLWTMGCCLLTIAVAMMVKVDPSFGKKQQ